MLFLGVTWYDWSLFPCEGIGTFLSLSALINFFTRGSHVIPNISVYGFRKTKYYALEI